MNREREIIAGLGENKKIVFRTKTTYSELFQSIDLKFSFLWLDGDTIKQLHSPVVCRDFLGDAILANMCKWRKCSVYGFDCTPKALPLSGENTLLSLHYHKKYLDILTKNIGIINRTEAYYGWEQTTLEPISDDVVLLISDKRWSSSTLFISIYTLVLRILSLKVFDHISNIDALIYKASEIPSIVEMNGNPVGKILSFDIPLIGFLMENHGTIFKMKKPFREDEEEPKIINITVHNNHGISAFIKMVRAKLKGSKGGFYVGMKVVDNFIIEFKKVGIQKE